MDHNLQFLDHALNAVDSKGRVSVPAGFRAKLAARAGGDGTEVVVHVGLSGTSDYLTAYDPLHIAAMHAEIEEGVSELPAAERAKERLNRQRNAFGPTDKLKFDDNGRIVLSAMARKLSGIDKLAFFIGVGDSFEIWEPKKALETLGEGPLAATLRYLLAERGVEL